MKICRVCKYNYAVLCWRTPLRYSILLNILSEKYNKSVFTLDIFLYCGKIIFTILSAAKEVSMSKPSDPKEKALRACGALHSHPVADALFCDSDFFDPRDLVQVKYEMLRRVHKEREAVSHAAASFGFSRPAFYKTQADFEREGLSGLLPRKRGPRGGHKLKAEVLEYLQEVSMLEQPMGIPEVGDEVEKRFGVRVHRRSLERALRRCEKKMPRSGEKTIGQLP